MPLSVTAASLAPGRCGGPAVVPQRKVMMMPDGLFLKIRESALADDVANTLDLADGVMVDINIAGEIVGITVLPPAFDRIKWMGGAPISERRDGR